MAEKAQSFKIGLFVVIGIGLFTMAMLRMEVLDWENHQRMRVLFNFTGGLEVGAPVHLAGVPVGEVEQVNILKDAQRRTRVEVVARLRKTIEIEEDAEVRIGTLGLLGTKYLEILPGTGMVPMKEGDAIEGLDPVMMDKMVAQGERIAQKVERTMDSLNGFFDDEEFRARFKGNVKNFSELLEELRLAVGSMNQILSRMNAGEGLMGKLLTDETVYDDLTDLVADVKAHPWKLLKKP